MNLILGNCLDTMRDMEPNSIDAIVTDPPYGLEFMGKEWDRLSQHDSPKANASYPKNRNIQGMRYSEYSGNGMQEWHYQWASAALRTAKPGCHLLAFGGTRTFHRLTCALEDAGWEIRDTLMWVYGSGFPKSHDVSKAIDKAVGAKRDIVGRKMVTNCAAAYNDGYARIGGKNGYDSGKAIAGEIDITAPATDAARQWSGWGTALKPAWEPIILARKPLEGTVAENVQKWGTGAINIDANRVHVNDIRSGGFGKGKRPWQKGIIGNDTIYESIKGRWPANLIHDGSEEVLGLFPESSITGNRKIKNRIQQDAVATPFTRGQDAPEYTDSGSAARFFYCAKASRAEREAGLEGMKDMPSQKMGDGLKSMVGHPSGNQGNTSSEDRRNKNHHPTVKPLALMRYLCRLVTPHGGIILDPFMGSGTTGMAAKQEGFEFIGIEKDKDYFEIAEKRISSMDMSSLFSPV